MFNFDGLTKDCLYKQLPICETRTFLNSEELIRKIFA